MEDLIKTLTETYGPSGNEERIREVIRKKVERYCDEVKVNALGNLICRKKGKGPKLMLAAHMDEIGLVVTFVDEKGVLRFSNIGGIRPYTLLGQRVIFANNVVGTIGEEKRESPKDELKLEKMFIDIGAANREEVQKMGIKVGDVASFQRNFANLGKRFMSKAMDDRIGCAVLVETTRRIKKSPLDLYFVFTVQEEVGVRGAATCAFGISPDFSIVVDVTATGDTPESRTMAVELGKGPAIKVKDMGLITHPKVKELLIETAEKEKIPYQLEVLESGATDAYSIHISREGVPSGVISIPSRYIHTPSEIVDSFDVENAVKLLTTIITSNSARKYF